MKIYFAGDGHSIEKTPFVNKMSKCNFLLSYGILNWNRFLWIIGKQAKLPTNIINILIKNYAHIFRNMAGRTESSRSTE